MKLENIDALIAAASPPWDLSPNQKPLRAADIKPELTEIAWALLPKMLKAVRSAKEFVDEQSYGFEPYIENSAGGRLVKALADLEDKVFYCDDCGYPEEEENTCGCAQRPD